MYPGWRMEVPCRGYSTGPDRYLKLSLIPERYRSPGQSFPCFLSLMQAVLAKEERASASSSLSDTFFPKEREQVMVCFAEFPPSIFRQLMPRNSQSILSPTTPMNMAGPHAGAGQQIEKGHV